MQKSKHEMKPSSGRNKHREIEQKRENQQGQKRIASKTQQQGNGKQN